MLRHPRRDRFAISWTPERERREAAFADTSGTPGNPAESNESQQEYKSPSPETQDILRNIAAGTHLSAEATLSMESRESLEKSPLILDAIGDISHPSDHVQEVLRGAMERAGVPSIENEGPGDAIAAWHDKKREEKLLNDEQIAKARAEILRNVTEDPETLLALIRSLENQRKRYGEFLRSMDVLTPEGKPLDPAERTKVETMVAKFGGPAALLSGVDAPKKSLSGEPKILHGILTRADAAQGIQSLIKAHGQESVEEWIGQARPDEILHLLDIPAKEMEKPGTLKRAVDLLTDWTNRINFGKFRWNPNDSEPKDNEKRGMQENYFAEMDRHLTGLKVILKEKLEKQANVLSARIDADVRRGSAAAAGIPVEHLYDHRYALKDKWDTSITLAHEKQYDVTLEETFENINAIVDVCKRSRGLKIHAPDFLTKAESHLKQLEEFREDKVPDLWQHAIVEAKREHEALEPWIRDYVDAYNSINGLLDKPKVQEFIIAMTGAKDMKEAREHLQGVAEMLKAGEAKDLANAKFLRPTTVQLTVKLQEMLRLGLHEKIDFSAPPPDTEALTKEIDEAEDLLKHSRIRNSEVCTTLGITGKLAEQIRTARLQVETMDGTASQDGIRIMHFEMQQLQQALRFIENSIPKQPSITAKNCFGYCDFGAPEYFVNPDQHRKPPPKGRLDENELRRTADHEFGHLVLDTLTERTSALVGLMDERNEYLKMAATNFRIPNDAALETYLETAARSWGMDRMKIVEDGNAFHSVGNGEAYYRRKRTEELLMQYATYQAKRDAKEADYDLDQDKEYPQSVKTLFRILDAEQHQPVEVAFTKQTIFEKSRADNRYAIALRDGPEESDDPAEAAAAREQAIRARLEAEAGGREAKVVAGPTLADFKKIRTHIQFISNYLHTYPEAASGGLGDIYTNAKKGYEEYFKQFDKHIRAFTENDRMPPLLPEDTVYIPENDGAFGKIIGEAINRLKVTEKQIKDFDALKMRGVVDAEPQDKEFWLWFTRDIQWLSIMDYWTMTTEGWEDITRLWKRRGETARGKVGELYTGWINDRVPYAGQLKHEFHRRQQSSEQDAVGVWEKALENVDSYKLIEDIEHVNNQDHLKAVMILLTKRGRLDWDDPKLWRALNRFSHFKIPEHECHRDPVLLDKWLQKVITDIWTDKDIYRSWKTTNDHSYNSERDKFAEVADFYSSSGLLGSQLEYMLETFVEAKENNKPIPDQVNPHLYEQLFLYAMEKGKMSMQEKFFYLIMGLKWKIIPFDRLAILNGKISTDTFPFIDYFYQQNNTEKDMEELAESLLESKTDRTKRFKPGPKTTAFLIEEVAHDEASRQRVTKVISRKGNTIDHEDIPMVTGYMTQGGWNNFLIVSSGALQRITSEGLKNAYVGYNTLFKVYGILAEKKAAVGQTLPPSDVEYLAERIVAFAHYDNVVVRQAIDNNNRPKLSLREIENETMPSGDGNKAKQYRDPVNNLVNEVFKAYAAEMEAELGPKNLKTVNEQGTEHAVDYDTFRKEYLGVDDLGDHVKNEKPMGANDKRGGHIYKMSGVVEDALIKAVNTDKGAKLIQLLRDKKGTFTNEGKEQLAFATHKDNFNRQERFARANGDH